MSSGWGAAAAGMEDAEAGVGAGAEEVLDVEVAGGAEAEVDAVNGMGDARERGCSGRRGRGRALLGAGA